jgi:hypothetical protein
MTSIAVKQTNNFDVPAVAAAASLTTQGLSRAIQGVAVGLYTAFIPMFYAYFAARMLGVNALCYDGLSTQAATAGLVILPFSMYLIALASKRSLKAVFATGAVASAVLGVIIAAVV